MSPALQAIREDFPDFHIGVIFPHREDIKRTPLSANLYTDINADRVSSDDRLFRAYGAALNEYTDE